MSSLTELDKCYKQLPRQLRTATENIGLVVTLVLDMAVESRALPVNEVLPATNAAEKQTLASLKGLRSKLNGSIAVFRGVHMPLSKDLVNKLHSFLDYVEDEEIFLALAVEGNAISRQCAEYALQAETTQQAFELLTAELACMAEEIKDQLKQAQLVIDNNIAKQHRNQQKLQRIKAVGVGCLTLGVGTGAVLALGLLGPGGLLFAPYLAAPAFSALVAGGACSAGLVAAVGEVKTHRYVADKESSKVLCQAHDFTKMHLSCAVERFRVGMKALAEFFSCLHASVQRIERTAATIEGVVQQTDYKSREYSSLHTVFKKQLRDVRVSCNEYYCFVTEVNSKVDLIQYHEEKPVLSYIEEWFEAQAKREQDRKAARPVVGRLHMMWKGTTALPAASSTQQA